MEPPEYEEMRRTLVRIAAHQETITEDLHAFNQQQLTIKDRLMAAIELLGVTQAWMETLLARLLRPEPNGQDV